MAYSLVIIFSDRRSAEETAEIFAAYNCKTLAIGGSGREALELARVHRPDVLITEGFLPFYNCDELAERLEAEGFSKMVKIAVCDEKNDHMAERFHGSGGDLFLVRPLDYPFCLKRIERFAKERRQLRHQSPVLAACRRLQSEMGMPPSVKGYGYIQSAIEQMAAEPALCKRLTKEIYPRLAAESGCTAKSVERCIRTAIDSAFKSGELEFLQQHFATLASPRSGRPTNKNFLLALLALVQERL